VTGPRSMPKGSREPPRPGQARRIGGTETDLGFVILGRGSKVSPGSFSSALMSGFAATGTSLEASETAALGLIGVGLCLIAVGLFSGMA
jgi:hypothetical protein